MRFIELFPKGEFTAACLAIVTATWLTLLLLTFCGDFGTRNYRDHFQMNFQEALRLLETLPDMERARHGSGISMSVESMKTLLALLGHPETTAKTIHITGSKGKGSTATFITSMLNARGFRTALFTSPHLHSYRERIAFDLLPVSEQDFARGVAEIAQLLHEHGRASIGPVSTFGILTALFFHLVAQARPAIDWQIVEVGLGGCHLAR